MNKTQFCTTFALLLPGLAAAADPAPAPAPAPAYTVTANVALASEYIFRGIGQTDRKPAIQGGFDFAHKSGFYVGTWESNISWLSDQGQKITAPIEMDFYGGFKNSVGDFSYDVGLLQYYYPGTFPTGFTSPNTLEGYVAGGWKWFTLKYSRTFGDLFGYAGSSGSGYIDLSAAFDIGAGVGLQAHVGHQDVNHVSSASYTDWKLGVTKDFVGLTFGLAYVDTNAKGAPGQPYYNSQGKNLGSARALFTVSKTF